MGINYVKLETLLNRAGRGARSRAAESMGVRPGNFSRMMRRKSQNVTVECLDRLASAVGRSPRELLTD